MRLGVISLTIALTLVATVSNALSFEFDHQGKRIEGYLFVPPNVPKALILYFHRAIEDRETVRLWADLLGPRGYAVAGYTATGTADLTGETQNALQKLRNRKDLSSIPVIAMGASLGTRAAGLLFVNRTEVAGLILIVPSLDSCGALKQARGRPVLIIEAEKDEVVRSARREILRCLNRNVKYYLLEGRSHRFPPALVAPRIIEWLEAL